jgi:N-acetylglutamate synthase-like GNAT family acetyltransferase
MEAGIRLRIPDDNDWPAILELANLSVADVPGGPQDDWLANRRDFAQRPGVQRHWVTEQAGVRGIAGYAGVETRPEYDGARIFVVTAPAAREDLGTHLLTHALNVARQFEVTSVWLIEYAADTAFASFLKRHGFAETRRFALEGGRDVAVLAMSLG